MIRHQYRETTGLCLLESLSMLEDIPLEQLTGVGFDDTPEALIDQLRASGRKYPKLILLSVAVQTYAPWALPCLLALITGIDEPEISLPMPLIGRGILFTWYPAQGRYPNGKLLKVHACAYEDEALHDPEHYQPIKFSDLQWVDESKIVYVLEKQD